MATFFSNLLNIGELNKWASLLDWLFDGDKFNNWDPNKVTRFTKRLKNQLGLGDYNYIHASYKNLTFPKRLKKGEVIVISGSQLSEGKDLVRHIRNGIAHGNARIISDNGYWIELKDFKMSKRNKTEQKENNQTAYIYFPIEYVFKIFDLYKEIKKQK